MPTVADLGSDRKTGRRCRRESNASVNVEIGRPRKIQAENLTAFKDYIVEVLNTKQKIRRQNKCQSVYPIVCYSVLLLLLKKLKAFDSWVKMI